jgi:hypothetical protein
MEPEDALEIARNLKHGPLPGLDDPVPPVGEAIRLIREERRSCGFNWLTGEAAENVLREALGDGGKDAFFSQESCDRCGIRLAARTMSWFTDETICTECAHSESALKSRLRAAGIDPDELEGCGCLPEPG